MEINKSDILHRITKTLMISLTAAVLFILYMTTQAGVASKQLIFNSESSKKTGDVYELGENSPMPAGVRAFSDVCIEPREHASHTDQSAMIVIYGQRKYEVKQMHVGVSPNEALDTWDVTFSKNAVPEGRDVIDGVAFFVTQTCPGNLHHFIEDELLGLGSVMLRWDRFREDCHNYIHYRKPPLVGDPCRDVTSYELLLKLININITRHDVFNKTELGTCYKTAVFGIEVMRRPVENDIQVVNRIKEQVLKAKCPERLLLIIQRKHRQILNTDALKVIATAKGFRPIITDLSSITMIQQIQLAACSSVLIGVQGAGLEWAKFMKNGSSFIEVAWPEKYWDFYYGQFMEGFGLNLHRLYVPGEDVKVNWESYEKKERGGAVVTDTKRETLLKSPPIDVVNDNIWKWADVKVSEDAFSAILDKM